MPREVTLPLDEFGREALDRFSRGRGTKSGAARTAALYYLADRESRRTSWRAPPGSFDGGSGGMAVKFDPETWSALEQEAVAQGVDPDALAVHAILYFLADLDSGRLAARLEDALQDEE